MGESWKKLKTSNVFSLFIVCLNRNRSALVCNLLSYNFAFPKSIFFHDTTELTVSRNSLVIVSSPAVVNPTGEPVSLERNRFS